jgi:hypothetical protein
MSVAEGLVGAQSWLNEYKGMKRVNMMRQMVGAQSWLNEYACSVDFRRNNKTPSYAL